MDRGIGAEMDLRSNGSNITARLFCLARISTVERHSLTTQLADFTLIFLLTFLKADYVGSRTNFDAISFAKHSHPKRSIKNIMPCPRSTTS